MNVNLMKQLFPQEIESMEKGNCPICKQEVGSFRNEGSVKEFKISGMCQKCQDDFFGKD